MESLVGKRLKDVRSQHPKMRLITKAPEDLKSNAHCDFWVLQPISDYGENADPHRDFVVVKNDIVILHIKSRLLVML